MFFSKVTLHPSAQTTIELSKLYKNGVYSIHQLLWRLFKDNSQRSFLFRQEQDENGVLCFYVLSTQRPVSDEVIFDIQVKNFNPQLKSGQSLGFKLRLNPTICITDLEGKKQRHDVLMHVKKQYVNTNISEGGLSLEMNRAVETWFANEKRLKQWGITLDMLSDVQSYTQHKSKKKGGHHIQFSSVDLEGRAIL